MSSPATTQASGAVDPADVHVSTTKDGLAEAITNSSRAAEKTGDEQGPSTSTDTGLQRPQLDGPESSSASDPLRRPRKSLPFLPRTTQYERHPLLQMRSTATGLSEFELLMLERDADERPRRMSVETSSTSQSSGRVGGRPALVPRSAHRETHPLFVRSADSGISELEEYLKEISQMTPPPRKSSAAGVQGRSSMSSQPPPAPTSPTDDDSKATAAPRKLEPRTSQCERHALLEIKDESGLTELERLLMEKDEAAAAEGSNGRRCTVCGAEARLRCDCSRRTTRDGVNADGLRSGSDTATGGFSSSDSATSAQLKRVRFMQQRQKTEPGGAASAAQLERTISDSAATAGALPPTSKSNSVDTSSAVKKPSKSRSSRGRGTGTVRTDSAPAGVGTGGTAHRKSCCVS